MFCKSGPWSTPEEERVLTQSQRPLCRLKGHELFTRRYHALVFAARNILTKPKDSHFIELHSRRTVFIVYIFYSPKLVVQTYTIYENKVKRKTSHCRHMYPT